MANNRMYLKNTRTGAIVLLAKFYPSTGWFASNGLPDRLNEVFDDADFGHLSPEARLEKSKQTGLAGPRHLMAFNVIGDEWVLEYDDRTETDTKPSSGICVFVHRTDPHYTGPYENGPAIAWCTTHQRPASECQKATA